MQFICDQAILWACSPKSTYPPLLVDEELTDQVWEAWDKGEIDDQVAWLAW